MSTHKRIPVVILAASLIVLVVGANARIASTAQASPPAQQQGAAAVTIPYPGRLNSETGQAVSDGAYDFLFTVYAAETGGEPVWTETQSGVVVSGGTFAVSLGSLHPIPQEVMDGRNRWLEVAVRGSGESQFTALTPRQVISTVVPASPSSPSAACAHDHLGETWNWYDASNGLTLSGNVPWPGGLLYASNSSNGPAVWGVNVGGGNAIRGDGYGNSIGVYGEGADGNGVAGNSSGNDGISGGTSAADKSGVYAHAHGTAFNYGLFAESESGRGVNGVDGGGNPDDSYGVYSQGDMYTTDDLGVADQLNVYGLATFSGGKSGYVVDIAQNDDSVSLEPGDVVVISGVGEAVVGQIPVIKVRRATAADAGAVVGVVDQHYVPSQNNVQIAGQVEKKAESIADNGTILPGEYLTVVTLGSFKVIKVDASYGTIKPGSWLVASPNPGYAMVTTSPQPGTIIGKALAALETGTGLIPVIVTLQ